MTRVRCIGIVVYRNDHLSAFMDFKNENRLIPEISGLQTLPNKNVKVAHGLPPAAAVDLAHAFL